VIRAGTACSGGGVANDAATLTVTHSLVYHNISNIGGSDSGGIANIGEASGPAQLTVDNSTISNNTSSLGGGIFSWLNGGTAANSVTITNSTIAYNDGGTRSMTGGGVLSAGGTISVQSSILAFNTVSSGGIASNCGAGPGATISSLGFNIETGTDCGFAATGDRQSTDPKFMPPRNNLSPPDPDDNGGNTQTFALQAASPAVDAIPPGTAGCGGTDQRDISRPQGTGCDIGAYEVYQPVEGKPFSAHVGSTVCGVFGSITIDWGDGTTSLGTTGPGGFGPITGTHTYAEEGVYHLTVSYTDDCGTHHDPFDLKVQDAPLSAAGSSISAAPGQSFTGPVATVTDADPAGTAADYSALINWGDGTNSAGTVAAGTGGFIVSGTHTYGSVGSFATHITIADAGGATAAANGAATATTKPTAVTSAPLVLGSSAAGFAGLVNPEGLPTTAHFEYGLDAKYQITPTGQLYDHATPDQAVGSDSNSHSVSTTVTGLVPNALYHVRLVASNGAGTTNGPDKTFMTAKDPAPPAPTLGKTFNAAPESGLVFIKLPGGHTAADGITKGVGFIPLTEVRQLPPGTQVDARQGGLKLVAAAASSQHIGKTQSFVFSHGLFKINSQVKKGIDKGLTNLSLLEDIFPGSPSYKSCTAHAAGDQFAHAAISRSILQTLHASGHGRFRTRGRYSAGTVRGTIWDTIDRCDGTLTTVRRGTVDVYDYRLRKTIVVHAHHSYLAKAPVKRKK
jgi:hypothetical protein